MEFEKDLPKAVTINGQTYAIHQDRDGYLQGSGCSGEIFYQDLSVIIRSTLPESRKHETFCHELVHGLRYEAGLMPDRISDEAEIRPLGAALYSLLRENDFSYMYKGSPRWKGRVQEEAKNALACLERGSVYRAVDLLKKIIG